MAGAIENLYIYDEHNRPILTHSFRSHPIPATTLLQHYLAHPAPRPSLIYLPNASPSTLLFSLTHTGLLFFLTSSAEIEPLLALEFLHRVIDILEEFVGAPLLAVKIEGSYDVVAQLLTQMCDGGVISTTEGNALRDLVEVEGWVGKLLGGINIPGKPGFAAANSSSSTSLTAISSSGSSAGNSTPALPWRRANVRHTSNEIYVDMVETLSVIYAPSGRPLSAFANGTIAFTAKISGVPDLLLSLSTPSGKQNIAGIMELPVFHPCVRLARWRERPGELSFIPPDGRFVLAGYEVDLLPASSGRPYGGNSKSSSTLNLPVQIEVKTSLGPAGADFEVRLTASRISGGGGSGSGPSGSGLRSGIGASGRSAFGSSGGVSIGGSGGGGGGGSSSSSASPSVDDLVVTVAIPGDVRTLSEIRPSRGDTTYNPGDRSLEWHVRSRDGAFGTATLKCTVQGELADVEKGDTNGFGFEGGGGRFGYDEDRGAYQSSAAGTDAPAKAEEKDAGARDLRKVAQNKLLMPSSATVSFAVSGWLASGIRVESLLVDVKKSRGLGEGVKPYKGVKYLTVSRGGVETRC